MNIVGIIPSRMASSRFPGKPLATIVGMPMIGHVYHRSKMAEILHEVYVATCDQEIADYIKSIGGQVIMTANTHERASDRTAEAVHKIEKKGGKEIDIVVMLQGDEPMVVPQMIEAVIEPLIDDALISISNLMGEIRTIEDWKDPNKVKVVVDKEYDAIYYSREPIPSKKKYTGDIPKWEQLGIIVFRKRALFDYTEMDSTPLEIIESVDMNRFIEHGKKIRMVPTDYGASGVDTEIDLKEVEVLMINDSLKNDYLC